MNRKAKRELTRRLFSTEDGKLVLAHLDEMFNHDNIVGETTHETYLRIGNKEPIEYINRLLGESENDLAK